ncbi:hypothetical protein BaRGS_00018539, partial [Batillaria attramentaria]
MSQQISIRKQTNSLHAFVRKTTVVGSCLYITYEIKYKGDVNDLRQVRHYRESWMDLVVIRFTESTPGRLG